MVIVQTDGVVKLFMMQYAVRYSETIPVYVRQNFSQLQLMTQEIKIQGNKTVKNDMPEVRSESLTPCGRQSSRSLWRNDL